MLGQAPSGASNAPTPSHKKAAKNIKITTSNGVKMVPIGQDTNNASFVVENDDTDAVENNDRADLPDEPAASVERAIIEPSADDEEPVENGDNGTTVENNPELDVTPDLDFNYDDVFNNTGELKQF